MGVKFFFQASFVNTGGAKFERPVPYILVLIKKGYDVVVPKSMLSSYVPIIPGFTVIYMLKIPLASVVASCDVIVIRFDLLVK